MPRLVAFLGGCWLLLGACSFDDSPLHCSDARPCATGQTCYRGFCVAARDAGATRDAAVGGAQPADAAQALDASPGSAQADAALAQSMSEPVPAGLRRCRRALQRTGR